MSIHGYVGNIITANPTAPTSTVASGVWTTEQQLIARAAGNWPFTIPTQQISRSLRFNSADSAYLNRTLGTSNRRTFTFSAWLKRSLLASTQCVFGNINYAGGGSTNQQFFLGFTGSDQLDMFHYNNGTQNQVTSTAVYRDPSAWYHIVGAVDTTQATSSNRLKIYVNGSQITTLTTATYPPQNTDTFINANLATGIGRQEGTGISGSYFFSGYQTEIYFIDGQALTPSSFGQINASTGVWEPLAYTGTYGTNGFYLNFSDNSNTTAATLGKDYSGNGNNWTPNNFSVTAGAGNDSLVDSPTPYGTDTGVGGEVRGNYCTLNPNAKYSGLTLSNGNLQVNQGVDVNSRACLSTISITSGKFYMEFTCDFRGAGANNGGIGWGLASPSIPWWQSGSASIGANGLGVNGNDGSLRYQGVGVVVSNYIAGTAGSVITNGDVMMLAYDADTGKVWMGKNGTWGNNGGTGNPATGANPGYTLASGTWIPGLDMGTDSGASQYTANFGQRAFAYTAPSGFKALCTTNLPTPTIGATSTTQANDYFNVVTYSGQATDKSVTGVGFQPDWVWIKRRDGADSHVLADSVRGSFGAGFYSLFSNLTNAESTSLQVETLDADGFTVDGDKSATNRAGQTYVAWNWNAGGSTVTNTSGTISAQVRASTTSGFSIVTYTGTGSNATVGHGLGVVPGMIIAKRRSATQNWGVAHSSLTGTQTLYLDLTQGVATGVWNGTPTSTVFNITTDGVVNTNGSTYVAYCFAPVAGYSAFGSYTGNGSTDGPFVYTGFRPRFVLWKNSTQGSQWILLDTARNTYNVSNAYLEPNTSDAENTGNTVFDMLSNGFKLRNSGGTDYNESANTYIYMAFAESPFKYALAR
jgi:hypothetical protein